MMSMLGRSVVCRADDTVWTVTGRIGEKYLLEESGGRDLRLVPVARFEAHFVESELGCFFH